MKEALDISERRDDTSFQILVCANLSIEYRSIGDYDSAKTYALKQLQLSSTKEGKMEAYAILGEIFTALHNYREAMNHYKW